MDQASKILNFFFSVKKIYASLFITYLREKKAFNLELFSFFNYSQYYLTI